MNIGKSLKMALIMRGMTQVQLAKKLERSEVWINKLAASKDTPNGATISMLAQALRMKVSEFVALGED